MRTVAYLAACAVLGAGLVYVGVRVSMWFDARSDEREPILWCLTHKRTTKVRNPWGCSRGGGTENANDPCVIVDAFVAIDAEQARYDRRFDVP